MSIDKMKQKVLVSSAFRPGTPIDQFELFAGRTEQVNDVLNAALQPGRHVIMFGERGVGKTSLARVISAIIKALSGYKLLNSGTINCDSADTFDSLWRKIFRELSYVIEGKPVGFSPVAAGTPSLDSILPDRNLNSDDVRYILGNITDHTLIIIDELDRLVDRSARTQLADTIKNLSDHAVNTTLMLVGVADSVDDLIAEHQSISRAIIQVPMPRMSKGELIRIIDTGLKGSEMTAQYDVKHWIAELSQGLPHYTHSLGLYSAFNAIESDRTEITAEDVFRATKTTVEKSHTIRAAYHKAVRSPQKQTLYAKVLRSCALAETDELGYFTAAAVSIPMSAIMGRKYYVPNFSRHLFHLCNEERARILKQIGESRKIRFRFAEPMMQAFVIIHDYSIGLLTNELLRKSRGRTVDEPTSGSTT